MKIAVSATGGSLESLVSEKFGRCEYFLIIESESMKFEAMSNLGEKMPSGAGPKAAETIIKKGAQVILTGAIGGRAEAVLKSGNVTIVTGIAGKIKVKDAVENYLKSNS
ncbi:NifB/NifX family molybdenum-iron cluster-binding protein [Bacteroidota bacterium]